ncbi:MAG: CHASE2 domain-containing protein [Betaproteobacteria bacterium]|nr:CHASE2 domain-containing protein [Betaproteobacteria bacterium]
MIERLENLPYWPRAAIFVAIALLLALLFSLSDVFRKFDNELLDALNRVLAPSVSFGDVAVIDIDEDTVTKLQPRLGAFPYDREIYGKIVQWLKRVEARAVVFDMVFAEPRRGDDAFAQALDERFVLGAAALPYTFARDTAYRARAQQASWGAEIPAGALLVTDITLPLAALTARAGVGVVSTKPDGDGVLRRVPLAFGAYGQLLPGAALRALYPGPAPKVAFDGARLAVNDRRWPVDREGQVLLHYPRNLQALPTISFY